MNLFGCIATFVWLIIEGHWSVLFILTLFVLFGHWLLGFSLLIGMVFAVPGMSAMESGERIKAASFFCATIITRVVVLSLWAYFIFNLFSAKIPDNQLLTCFVIFCATVGSVVYLAIKNSDDPDDPSKGVALITQLGCLAALSTWYFFQNENYHLYIFPIIILIGEVLNCGVLYKNRNY